jgi:small-conductance mechanosensitive channel
MIPNSIIAKAIVTNHRRLNSPHVVTVGIKIDHRVPPARVLEALKSAAIASPGISPQMTPTAYACGFEDAVISYELCFGIDNSTSVPDVQSCVVQKITDTLQGRNIAIGGPAIAVRLVASSIVPIATGASKSLVAAS